MFVLLDLASPAFLWVLGWSSGDQAHSVSTFTHGALTSAQKSILSIWLLFGYLKVMQTKVSAHAYG